MALDTGHTDFIFLALLLLPLLAQKDWREPKKVAVEVGHIKFIFLTPFLLWPHGSRARIQTRKWKENIYLTDPWGLQTNGQSRMHYAHWLRDSESFKGPPAEQSPYVLKLRVQVPKQPDDAIHQNNLLPFGIYFWSNDFWIVFSLPRDTAQITVVFSGRARRSLFISRKITPELPQNFFIGNGIWVTVLIVR